MDQIEERKREGWFDRVSYQADRAARFLVALMMAVMSAIVLFGVFNRFIFKIPISWTEEIAKYLLIWISMIGSAIAVRIGGHMGVGMFVSKLRQRPRTVVTWINQLAIVGFIVILIYLGMKVSIKELHTFGYTTRIPMFWPFLAIPVGGLMILIQLLSIIKMLFKNESPPLGY
jgi:TRAP-type C4-dicarboxylate transport system permease small subunit